MPQWIVQLDFWAPLVKESDFCCSSHWFFPGLNSPTSSECGQILTDVFFWVLINCSNPINQMLAVDDLHQSGFPMVSTGEARRYITLEIDGLKGKKFKTIVKLSLPKPPRKLRLFLPSKADCHLDLERKTP